MRVGYLPTISLQICGKALASDGGSKWNEWIRWKSDTLYVVKPSQLPIHLQRKKHQPFSHILSLKEYFNFKASYIKILYNPLAFFLSLMLIFFIELSQLLKKYSWCSSSIKLNTRLYLAKTQYTSLLILTISTCWHCLGEMNFDFIWI